MSTQTSPSLTRNCTHNILNGKCGLVSNRKWKFACNLTWANGSCSCTPPLEIGKENNVALRHACFNGHTEIVRLLLELPLERARTYINRSCFLELPLERAPTFACMHKRKQINCPFAAERVCLILDSPLDTLKL